MNYREIIRKAVSSPWDGTSTTYGQWGALRPEQRKLILRLLDEMDSADEYIKHLFFENEDLKRRIKSYEERQNQGIELTEVMSIRLASDKYILDKIEELEKGSEE